MIRLACVALLTSILGGACAGVERKRQVDQYGYGWVFVHDNQSEWLYGGARGDAPAEIVIGAPLPIDTRWARTCWGFAQEDAAWNAHNGAGPDSGGGGAMPCDAQPYTLSMTCGGVAADCPAGQISVAPPDKYSIETRTEIFPTALGELTIEVVLVHARGIRYVYNNRYRVVSPDRIKVPTVVVAPRPIVKIEAFLAEGHAIPTRALRVNGQPVPDQRADLRELFPDRRTAGDGIAAGDYELDIEIGKLHQRVIVKAISNGPITGMPATP